MSEEENKLNQTVQQQDANGSTSQQNKKSKTTELDILELQQQYIIMENKRKTRKEINTKVKTENQERIFSVLEFVNNNQCNKKKINIQNSFVNIYALKYLIKMVSQNIENIIIENCQFYTNDKSTLQQQKSQLDNKMLRELNFQFLVKTLQLPQIENIDIKLKDITDNQERFNSKQITQKENINKYKDSKDQIQVQCFENSQKFVDFEEIQQIKKKWDKYANQKEIVDYLINGNPMGDNQIKDCINTNIVNEIKDYAKVFGKYIKNSFYQNILIIKEECMDEPIAQKMIFNLIFKESKKIKTIMFKETGSISYVNIQKITDAMYGIENLESIAFFASQPEKEAYYLFKNLFFKLNNFKYFVINKCSLNISQYRHDSFESEKSGDESNKNFNMQMKISYYGYYILEKDEIYEFTPYDKKYVDDLLKTDILIDSKKPELQIQDLITKQEGYSQQIKDEINKYKDEDLLKYKQNSEKFLIKYFNRCEILNETFENQQELEDHIKMLIKYYNQYNLRMISKLIGKINNPQIQESLIREFNRNKNITPIDCKNQVELQQRFINDQKLILKKNYLTRNAITGYYFYKEENPLLQRTDKFIEITEKDKKEIKLDDIISEINQFIPKKTPSTFKGIYILFSKTFMQIMEIHEINDKEKKYQERFISSDILENDKPSENGYFYFNSNLHNKLSELFFICSKEKELQIELDYQFECISDVIKHLNLIAENQLSIERLILQGFSEDNLDQLKNIAKIKSLKLIDSKIKSENFFNKYEFETIELQYCEIIIYENCSINKNLKNLILNNSQLNKPQIIIESLLNAEEEQSGRNLLLEMKLVKKVCKNKNLNKENNIDISSELVSKIIQKKVNFHLYNLSYSTYSLFYQNISRDSLQILQHERFSGNKLFKNYKIPNKSAMTEKSEKENNELTIFKQLKNTYLENPKLELYYQVFNSRDKKDTNKGQIKQVINYVGDCCKKGLEVKQDTNISELNNHNDEFCFFKTSVFQKNFNPQKIQIKFFHNLLFSDKQILDCKSFESIQELDFSHNYFSDKLQVNFVDYLIQVSSNLKNLKFKEIDFSILRDVKLKPITNKGLKNLSLKVVNNQYIIPVVEAIKEVATLESLKMLGVDLDKNIKILENNSSNLLKLKVSIQTENQWQATWNCKKLQKLEIQLLQDFKLSEFDYQICQSLEEFILKYRVIERDFVNYQKILQNFTEHAKNSKLKKLEIQLDDIIRLDENILKGLISQHLEQITIYSTEFEINQRKLENFLNHAQTFKNLQKITLNRFSVFKQYQKNEGSQFLNICSEIQIYKDQEQNRIFFDEIAKNQSFTLIQLINQEGLNTFFQQLQVLNLDRQPQQDYLFLNNVFEQTKSSLIELSMSKCYLNDESFNHVNFENLPKTIQVLNFSENRNLKSLKFLDKIHQKIRDYKDIKYLNLNKTKISFSQIIKYCEYIKELYYKGENISYFKYQKYLIQSLFSQNENKTTQDDHKNTYDDIQECTNNILSLLNKVRRNKNEVLRESEIRQLYSRLFQLEIPQIKNKASPFIISSLSLSSSNLKYDPIIQLFKKCSSNQIIKSLYLLYTGLSHENSEFILGYSQKHHQHSRLKSFGDYIQLSQLLSKKVKNVYLPFTLEISEQFFYKENSKYKALQIDNKKDLEEKEELKDKLFNSQNNQQIKDEQQIQQEEKDEKSYIEKQIKYDDGQNKIKRFKESQIDEFAMIQYLSKVPPSEIAIEDMSIQFIKTWYVINTISPLTLSTKIIHFDKNQVYNILMGSYIFQFLPDNNFIKNLFNFNPQKYRYDETVQLLANQLSKDIKMKYHALLLSLFPLYIFICIFCVIYFSLVLDITCGNGISWYSYYCYIVYAVITLFIELYMFTKCLNYISHLVPNLELDLKPGFVIKIINFIKQVIIESTWVNQWYMGYSFSFFQSQLSRFDNFTNVAFLYSTYRCGDMGIFYASLCFISIPFLYSLYEFYEVIFKSQKKLQLPTYPLDIYYKICNIIEFKAVADILDLVSPSNVTVISGRMFNSRIVSSFVRIVGESIPLVIIQINNLSKREMTSSLVLSLLLSIITLVNLLVSFFTITPSTLDQEDFDKLNKKKKDDKVLQNYEDRLQEYEDETFALRIYDHLNEKQSEFKEDKQNQNQKNLKNYFYDYERYFNKLFNNDNNQKNQQQNDGNQELNQ